MGRWKHLAMHSTAVVPALFGFAAPSPAAVEEVKVHVAPDGRDTWSGTVPRPDAEAADGPFATLEGARDAIRQIKARGELSTPVTVYVGDGTLRLSSPFVLRPEDSGTARCPITYAAGPEAKPILSGAERISGWRPGSGGLWVTEIPDVRRGTWVFRQLFVNGGPRRRTRLPEEGSYPIAGPAADPYDAPLNKRAFRFRPGDVKADWANLEHVEVVVLQHWTEARLPISSVDETKHIVTLSGPSWRPLTWSTGYVVENLREALTKPGQWYLDRVTGVLTYFPLPEEDMRRAEVVAPRIEQLLRIEGDPGAGLSVEHVTFRGLTFAFSSAPLPVAGHAYPQAEAAVAAAIHAEGARHCTFEGNEFVHLGQWGLGLSHGCADNRVVANRIHHVGAGGLKVGEPKASKRDGEETSRNVISDNVVHDGNQLYMGAPGIWIGHSGGNTVAHNEVYGPWQWGISVGWRWQIIPPSQARDNTIEYNHIHHLGEGELGTHAAIYCLGLSPGTVVRHNHVHHVSGKGYGIILDQGCCAVLVENNLVHDTYGGWCSNFHSIGNVVMNNVFALVSHYQIQRYGDNPPKGFSLSNTNIFCRNILYWREGKLFKRDKWLDFSTIQDHNLYFDTRGPVSFMGSSLAEWRRNGLDRQSRVADPCFTGPEHGDFTLNPDSPAFDLGFRPIDVRTAGPR